MNLHHALTRTVRLINLPFGYTLTIWASGAIVAARFGLPSPAEALLFALGASCGYVLCAAASVGARVETVEVHVHDVCLANFFALAGSSAAWLTVSLIDRPELAFPLAGCVGTATYILCVSGLALTGDTVRRRSRSSRQLSHRRRDGETAFVPLEPETALPRPSGSEQRTAGRGSGPGAPAIGK
jgi:hypothetical protein